MSAPGRFILWSNTGHSIHNERPRALSETITEFIASPARESVMSNPTAILLGGDDLGLLYRGGSDGSRLALRQYTGGAWRPEEIFDAPPATSTSALTSTPAAVTGWASSRLAVFYRDPHGQLRRKLLVGNAWQDDQALANTGLVLSAPSVVTATDGGLGVFYRGVGGRLVAYIAEHGALFPSRQSFDAGHRTFTGRLTSAPAAVANWDLQRFAVFFRGEDGRLWSKGHIAGSWLDAQPVSGGSVLWSDPAVTRFGDNKLGVFYRVEDNRLAWRAYDGTWQGEEVFAASHPSVGAKLASATAVVSGWRSATFAVFYRGEDGAVRLKVLDNGRWRGDERLP